VPAAAAAAAATTTAATRDTNSAIQSGTGVAPAGAGASGTTELAKKSFADSTTQSSESASGGRAVNKSLYDQLSDLLTAADDPKQSASVLSTVRNVEANATTSGEFKLIGTLRAKVAAAGGDEKQACEELKKVVRKVNADDLESLKARAVAYAPCTLE
jgi:hypothetical protein